MRRRFFVNAVRNGHAAIEGEDARHLTRVLRAAPREAGPRLILCAALIKFDRFEWIIEKATELGVSDILPVGTARSERGLERAARKRLERWRHRAARARGSFAGGPPRHGGG